VLATVKDEPPSGVALRAILDRRCARRTTRCHGINAAEWSQALLRDADGPKITHTTSRRGNTNITGTVDLIQNVGRDMRERGGGRILITGSIAGFFKPTLRSAPGLLAQLRTPEGVPATRYDCRNASRHGAIARLDQGRSRNELMQWCACLRA
jgi:NAD(P)-dependent dehydrogenase (short-subunit alcohol dehydrogenase family)